MAIFLRIKDLFPSRKLEWFLASLTLALGLTMLLFPASFERPGLQVFSDLMPPLAWAMSGLILGVMHISSLIINGHNSRVSIPFRWLSSILEAGFFGLFTGRFFVTSSFEDSSIAFGLVTYSFLVIGCMVNIRQTVKEFLDYIKSRR